jgi:site-specific recombinase XerD
MVPTPTASIVSTNPVRDVQAIRSKAQPKGATALTGEQSRELLAKLHASAYCQDHDLADPVTLLIATGIRRSELLALRWVDFDADACTLAVAGKLVRATGQDLNRIDDTKSAAGKRTLPLPQFSVDALKLRQGRAFVGEQPMILPSTTGTWRDPNNFGKQWRTVREELGVPDITTHSFRKTIATLIDDAGLSPRVGADQLGHSKVSMTQDTYMARGRVHVAVAELLDRAINDESHRSRPKNTLSNYPPSHLVSAALEETTQLMLWRSDEGGLRPAVPVSSREVFSSNNLRAALENSDAEEELKIILAIVPANEWVAISTLARAYWPTASRWSIADNLRVEGDPPDPAIV